MLPHKVKFCIDLIKLVRDKHDALAKQQKENHSVIDCTTSTFSRQLNQKSVRFLENLEMSDINNTTNNHHPFVYGEQLREGEYGQQMIEVAANDARIESPGGVIMSSHTHS
jgi:hypothetical protein